MSFFGNNSRPDLLKGNGDEERTPRSSEARFIGEMPQAPEPVPSFGSESRYGSSALSGSAAGPTPPDRCENVVGSGARWKGSLKVEADARIDGVFSGDIEAKGTVHISEGAEVDAKIHAAFVVVAGSFRGEVRADQKTELMPSARMSGEIYTKAFAVQEGAIFDGSIQMSGEAARNANARSNRNGATADRETASERRERAEAPASTNGA